MIIDFHAHMFSADIPSKSYWDDMARFAAKTWNVPESKARERQMQLWDITGDLLINDMDQGGIDKCVVSYVDYGPTTHTWEYSLDEQHKFYSEAAEKYPNRIIAFAGVDPRRQAASEFLEHCIVDFGMRGLKLMPAAGWYPNDKVCYPLYGKAQELNIPILFHTGPQPPPFYSKYCRPIDIDEIAVDFPDLVIVMAHASYCWWPEAATIASIRPNIFLDLSGWQPMTLHNPLQEFYRPIRSMLDTIGSPKLVFGTDWPAYRLSRRMSYAVYVQAFKELPQDVIKAGIHFSDEEINAILGGNAASILGIQ